MYNPAYMRNPYHRTLIMTMKLIRSVASKPTAKLDEEEKEEQGETQKAPKEPSKFEFSSDMPAMSAQDL
jgi:hypothetical protein